MGPIIERVAKALFKKWRDRTSPGYTWEEAQAGGVHYQFLDDAQTAIAEAFAQPAPHLGSHLFPGAWLITGKDSAGKNMPMAFSYEQAREIARRINEHFADVSGRDELSHPGPHVLDGKLFYRLLDGSTIACTCIASPYAEAVVAASEKAEQ